MRTEDGSQSRDLLRGQPNFRVRNTEFRGSVSLVGYVPLTSYCQMPQCDRRVSARVLTDSVLYRLDFKHSHRTDSFDSPPKARAAKHFHCRNACSASIGMDIRASSGLSTRFMSLDSWEHLWLHSPGRLELNGAGHDLLLIVSHPAAFAPNHRRVQALPDHCLALN